MQTNAIYGKQYHIFRLEYTRVYNHIGIFTYQQDIVSLSATPKFLQAK